MKARWHLKELLRFDFRYFARGGFWLLLLRIVSAGSSFLLSIVYARYLSKEVYGEFRYILAAGGVMGALSLTGLANAVIPAVARGNEGTLRAAFRKQFEWSWILAVCGFGVAAYHFARGDSSLGCCFLLVAVCLPLASSFNIYEALLKGRGDFKSVARYGLAQKLCRDVALALAVAAVGSVFSLTFAAFALPAFLAGYFFLHLASTVPAIRSRVDPEAIPYGTKLSIFRAFNISLGYIDNLLMFSLFGAPTLAVYSFVKVMPDSLASLLTVFQPMFLKKLSSRGFQSAKAGIWKGFSLFTAAFGVVVLAYYYLSPWLYRQFFPQYVEATHLSQIYALKLIPTGSFLIGLYFHAQYKTKRTLFTGTARILVGYACLVPFLVWRTLDSMVLARVAGEFLLAALNVGTFLWGQPKTKHPSLAMGDAEIDDGGRVL